MRIAIDVTPVLPDGKCGGAKQLLLELLKGLGKRGAAEKIILLTSKKNSHTFAEYKKLNMKPVCVTDPDRYGISFFRRLYIRAWKKIGKISGVYKNPLNGGVLKKYGISVLFCPMTALTYCTPGIPGVSVIHDLQHFYYPAFFSKDEIKHRHSFYNHLKKNADYIICVSEFTKKTVMEKLGIPGNKIFVIHNCIQDRLTVPVEKNARRILEKYNLYGKDFCIYPANFWPHKNHTMLLVAFRMFLERFPEKKLHLVLTGEELERGKLLKDAVLQMNLQDKAHIVGYLPEEELSAVWYHSYFLVFPSLFEGFGIPLLEAMKYKKPILAGHTSSIPEVAGDAAIYFDPWKPAEICYAINRIMEDNQLYRDLVQKGQKQLEKFNFSLMVDSYVDVLRQISEKRTYEPGGLKEKDGHNES